MKKNIKILSAVAVITCAPLSFALGGDPYIGGTIGHGWSKQDLSPTVGDVQNTHLRGDSLDLAAIAGWGWNFDNNIFLGVEGELGYSVDNADNIQGLPHGDNNTFSLGAYGRAGMWFGQNIMFYGKMGVKHNNVSFDAYDDITVQSFEFGAGFDYILNSNWTLRTEFAQESYMGDEGVYKDYKMDKRQESLSMGVMYHF